MAARILSEKPALPVICNLTASFANGGFDVGDDFGVRFCANVTLAVQSDRDVSCLHISRTDDQHGMHLGLLGAENFSVDLVAPEITLAPNHP